MSCSMKPLLTGVGLTDQVDAAGDAACRASQRRPRKVFPWGTLYAKPRIRVSPPGRSPVNVSLRNISCSPMRSGIRRERKPGSESEPVSDGHPIKGRLADMDHIVLSRPISRRVPVLLPVLTAIGPAVMTGDFVGARFLKAGRRRSLDRRQGIANGERMLGSRTPNFCDAASEFDKSTATGHPDEGWRRRGACGVRHAGKPTSTG